MTKWKVAFDILTLFTGRSLVMAILVLLTFKVERDKQTHLTPYHWNDLFVVSSLISFR